MTKPDRRPILQLMRGLDPVGTGRQVELAAEACRAAGHDVQTVETKEPVKAEYLPAAQDMQLDEPVAIW